jgi:TATA-box binding protein (TBP) (component of TFIID and TFIIIB)
MQADTEEYVREMLEIRGQIKADILPSFISLTTITCTFKINREIDVPSVREFFKDGVPVRRVGSNEGFTWVIKENQFYNQVTTVLVDSFSRKSVKFFPNGRVHVTGCSDLYDILRIKKQVECIFSSLIGEDVQTNDLMIHMINTNFSMNYKLSLMRVIEICEAAGCEVSFKPENYSAVKIKIVGLSGKKITASIFSSGCILVTGATTLKDITQSYKFLTEALRPACLDASKDQKKFEFFMGYSLENDWIKLLGHN